MRLLLLAILTASAYAADRYPVTGIILKVDRAHRTFDASCDAIPNYMAAMAMTYSVDRAAMLDGFEPGQPVTFTLVVDQRRSHVEDIRPRAFQSMEQEPFRAHRLQLLQGDALPKAGDAAPDFDLVDQTGRPVTRDEFKGKVVALTFIYTSCPLPDYCFRLSNNFAQIARRFAAKLGKDLVLVSVSFDPEHDTPEVLAKYAATWKADPNSWRFLTGPLENVKALCHRFGLNFWQDEGFLTHSLRTAVVDRRGMIAGILQGNQFTAGQLGDLIQVSLQKIAPTRSANSPVR